MQGWEEYEQEGDVWMIMDRDTQADDNAEHLYRWIKQNHPEQKCYFALRKTSPDWKRLKREGFDLLDFGSKKHEKQLKKCSKIISSHTDAYVFSYFGDFFLKSKDLIYLQHGVIKDDLSSWFNPKPFSIFIMATKREQESIVSQGSPYAFTEKTIKGTGFPRHDRLLALSEKNKDHKPCILIMPTWREFLAGKVIGKSNERTLNDDFLTSDYKKQWEAFLFDPRLKALADKSIRLVLFPHANITPYYHAGYFKVPEYVEVAWDNGNLSIQDCFTNASLLVTDYSSVMFELAYIQTPMVYFQFDKAACYGGDHLYRKGYFSCEDDGFGPVTETLDEAISAVENYVDNNFAVEEKYLQRMQDTFLYRDGKCCERVWNAIKELDRKV